MGWRNLAQRFILSYIISKVQARNWWEQKGAADFVTKPYSIQVIYVGGRHPPQQDKTNRNFLNTIIKVNKLCEWYYWLYGLGTSLLTSVRSYLTLPRGTLPHPSKASRYSVCSILGIKDGGESIGAPAIHRQGYYMLTRSTVLGLEYGEHRRKSRPLNFEMILIPSLI